MYLTYLTEKHIKSDPKLWTFPLRQQKKTHNVVCLRLHGQKSVGGGGGYFFYFYFFYFF